MSLWRKEDLPLIFPGERPAVILLGNGINRAFNKHSWRELIEAALSRNHSPYTYSEISDLPATMQIVAACGNGGVKHDVQDMASGFVKRLKDSQDTREHDMLNVLLSVPFDALLTTNYTLELEKAAEGIENLYQFRSRQRLTRTVSPAEKDSRLFQFTKLSMPEGTRRIWHIHGDISTPNSIVIGHYYYGKLQTRMYEHIRNLCRTFRIAQSQGKPYTPVSWIDYFMLGDVYAFGIGMDSAEQDLWWLLACKQLEFSDTTFYFFEPERYIHGPVKKMLSAYGAIPRTDIPRKGDRDDDYIEYYEKVIEDLRNRLTLSHTGIAPAGSTKRGKPKKQRQ